MYHSTCSASKENLKPKKVSMHQGKSQNCCRFYSNGVFRTLTFMLNVNSQLIEICNNGQLLHILHYKKD